MPYSTVVEPMERLQLTERLFRTAIERLKQHLAELDDADASGEQTSALRLQICLYGVCLDRTRERAVQASGENSADTEAARREARDAFYRLMAVNANAQLAADSPAIGLPSSADAVDPNPMGWEAIFAQSQRTAYQQLERLLSL